MRGRRWSFRAVALLFAAATLLLCVAATYVVSSSPDGFEWIALRLGFAARAEPSLASPLADYEFPLLQSAAGRKMAAAVVGAAACFLVALAIGKYSSRRRGSVAPGSARPLE